MYLKTIVMTKHSCKGKEFTCIKEMMVMDRDERERRRRERYEAIRAEREHERLMDLQRQIDYYGHSSMRKIMDAYEEYMECERYY